MAISCDAPPLYYETWTVPTAGFSLEGFSDAEVVEALRKENIYLRFGDQLVHPVEKVAALRIIDHSNDRLVLKEGKVSVFLPSEVKVPCHLIIEMDGDKEDIADVTPEEMVLVHRMIRKISLVYREKKVNDFLIAWQNVCEQKKLRVEVIGTRPDSSEVLNKLYRADCHNWVERFLLPSPPELEVEKFNDPEEMKKMEQFFKEALARVPCPDPALPGEAVTEKTWIQYNSCFGSYKRYLVNLIYDLLERLGFSVARERVGVEPIGEGDEVFEVKKEGRCPFCNRRVLQNEAVFAPEESEGSEKPGKVLLLYNITSLAEFTDFLLIPRRHVARFEDLTEEEVSLAQRCLQIFYRVMRDNFGLSAGSVSVQNGHDTNQTVDHVHWRVHFRLSCDNAFMEALLFQIYCLIRDQGDDRRVSGTKLQEIVTAVKTKMDEKKAEFFRSR